MPTALLREPSVELQLRAGDMAAVSSECRAVQKTTTLSIKHSRDCLCERDGILGASDQGKGSSVRLRLRTATEPDATWDTDAGWPPSPVRAPCIDRYLRLVAGRVGFSPCSARLRAQSRTRWMLLKQRNLITVLSNQNKPQTSQRSPSFIPERTLWPTSRVDCCQCPDTLRVLSFPSCFT
jgi:hypothetical protein